MKIGIIGSRGFNNYELMTNTIRKLQIENQELMIISGGANGADNIAEYIAGIHNIKTYIVKPDFTNGYDVKQYFIRNDIIIKMSDKIIAFWDNKSHGTKYVIDKCKRINKPIEVISF